MGVMRFLVHPPEILDQWPEVHQAYIGNSFDARVYPTRIEIQNGVITCRRNTSESGRLHVAWPVSGFGQPILCTSCLSEREEPYLLSLELARGKISQVRDQLGTWEIAGMSIPDEFGPVHKAAHRLFASATASQDEPATADMLARQALAAACRAAEILTKSYIAQRLSVRRKRSSQPPASLGCSLGESVPSGNQASLFQNAFTAAAVPIEWRHIEPAEGEYHWDACDAQVNWCQEQKLLMLGGPLLDFSPKGLPDWLWGWEQDLPNLESFVCDFIETAIARYVGRVRHWEVFARMNTGGALALSEEHRLLLVARALEVARQIDQEVQLIIRIDQPWGDYQARGQHRLSPVQFVDALLRSGIVISGVNLEIGVGYCPRGSDSRDLLETSRLIDLWACLNIPLYVTLAFPSSSSADPHCDSDLEVTEPSWKQAWSEQAQADWIDLHLPLFLAKQSVVGVFWSNFSDAERHYFPNSGLLRSDGSPKPSLERLITHRHAYSLSDSDTQLGTV